EVAHLKDSLMPRYAEMIYNGYWWSPERKMLQAAIDESQQFVNGEVRVKLYKGAVHVVGRRSADSLFDEKVATFEDDRSEEHTSELQSRENLVCRLLLEKKKKPVAPAHATKQTKES